MSLHWSRRIRQWRTVLALKGARVSPWAMLRAVLSGPVPPDVWRSRLRICLRCEVFDHELKACRRILRDGRVLGCTCYTPFLAFTAVPYTRAGGCWAREISPHEGWGAFQHKSRTAKLRAIWRFLFP